MSDNLAVNILLQSFVLVSLSARALSAGGTAVTQADRLYADSLYYDFDSRALNELVVTATRTPKALKDVPVVTRVITVEEIKKTDATNIQGLLTEELPGLEFGFAMTQETSLNMSGFGGNAVLFLIDGERLAGETMDNVDYNRLNLEDVGQVEIVKGASSALYGANAVGGVASRLRQRFRLGLSFVCGFVRPLSRKARQPFRHRRCLFVVEVHTSATCVARSECEFCGR